MSIFIVSQGERCEGSSVLAAFADKSEALAFARSVLKEETVDRVVDRGDLVLILEDVRFGVDFVQVREMPLR